MEVGIPRIHAYGGPTQREVHVSFSRDLVYPFIASPCGNRFISNSARVRISQSCPCSSVECLTSSADVPTVTETKLNFLKAYKRPIPSIYNTVLQELIVQQHLMRYKKTYKYDPLTALGVVTVYDNLMEGYPRYEDRDIIFHAYSRALNEDPDQYRRDAHMMEKWAHTQNALSLVEFPSRGGEVEVILKGISERPMGKSGSSYSCFFAIGLFRLIELAGAAEPSILDKLCTALNVRKKVVDKDLDIYRNLLWKLVQAKEIQIEHVHRQNRKKYPPGLSWSDLAISSQLIIQIAGSISIQHRINLFVIVS